MSDNNKSVESYHAPRTWHNDDAGMQAFIQALSEGKVRNRYGTAEPMDKALINALLSRIESKQYFEELVAEYAATEELGEGYDVYNISRTRFFAENRELIMAHAIPSDLDDITAKAELIYKFIDYYNADEITAEHVKQVFFEGSPDTGGKEEDWWMDSPVLGDAWCMGCYAMNNIVLTDILDTYAASEGAVKPEPFISRPTIDRQSFRLIEDDESSALIRVSSEKWSDVQEPLSTRVTIAGNMLLNINPSDIENFKLELQALAKKYKA